MLAQLILYLRFVFDADFASSFAQLGFENVLCQSRTQWYLLFTAEFFLSVYFRWTTRMIITSLTFPDSFPVPTTNRSGWFSCFSSTTGRIRCWLIELTDYSIGWLIGWLIDWLIDRLNCWLIDRSMHGSRLNQQIGRLSHSAEGAGKYLRISSGERRTSLRLSQPRCSLQHHRRQRTSDQTRSSLLARRLVSQQQQR